MGEVTLYLPAAKMMCIESTAMGLSLHTCAAGRFINRPTSQQSRSLYNYPKHHSGAAATPPPASRLTQSSLPIMRHIRARVPTARP